MTIYKYPSDKSFAYVHVDTNKAQSNNDYVHTITIADNSPNIDPALLAHIKAVPHNYINATSQPASTAAGEVYEISSVSKWHFYGNLVAVILFIMITIAFLNHYSGVDPIVVDSTSNSTVTPQGNSFILPPN